MAMIPFTNAKAALAFAGMTILGTVMMVGTSDNKGMLGQMASSISAERLLSSDDASTSVEAESFGGGASRRSSEWGGRNGVFDDYVTPEGAIPTTNSGSSQTASLRSVQGNSIATAPLSPEAIVVDAKNAGFSGQGRPDRP